MGAEGAGGIHQFLKGLGVDLKGHQLETRNTAEVTVGAILPPHLTVGSRIDVVVSSVGNATSLEGGTLMMTPLMGADGSVYAMAQGKVNIGRRRDARGALISQILSSGNVIGGGVLEKIIPNEIGKTITFNLHQPDFTTASRIMIRINEELGGKYANSTDAGKVDVNTPYDYEGTPVELVALLENIEVEADRPAKIIVNERTGTVIMGERVTLSPVAISHGNLRLEIQNQNVNVIAREKSVALISKGTTVSDIANGLNDLGASPDDLVIILNSLKASGSLMAELEAQ